MDYLVGNTDRHPENWGFLVDNATNQPVSLYPLMDFNMSFQTYDKLDGANCQTTGARRLTQREAAIEAVQAIGLRQIRDVDLTIFGGMDLEREMFLQRLEELKKYRMDLDVYHEALTEENIKMLHENGIEINCWTVDNTERAEQLAAWGVDHITSNILE